MKKLKPGIKMLVLCILIISLALPTATFSNASKAYALDNGQALTPPMGWNSWNKFGCNINEDLILNTAKTMVANGMKDAGYQYINIDDCWMSNQRDANGNYVVDSTRFPHGMKWLADQIHDMGLKIGIYSSNGAYTCQHLPGGYGHEQEDAKKYAEWGIDYLKYDWCSSPTLQNSANIDNITIGKTVYEAEAPGNLIENGAAISNCATCSGGKEVGYIGNNKGTLTFTNVNADTSGSYDMSISYANSYAENNIVSRFAFVSVNGGEPQRVGFVNTGGWTSVGTTTIKVDLQAGNNTIKFYNPWTNVDNAKYVYSNMRDALNKAYAGTGRSIVLSLCEWGSNQPWLWGADVGNLWRTTGDISDNWNSVMSILDQQVGLDKYAGPGHWNDPDMLEVGNGGMTNTEYIAHFSLWSMLAAPLITGNDLPNMSDETKNIIMNKEVIAIDQDSLGVEGKKISDTGDQEVWVKPLANGDRAVLLLNRGSSAQTVSADISVLGMPHAASYILRDVWAKTETAATQTISASVPSHGVVMYRVKKGTPDMAAPATVITTTGVSFAKPGNGNAFTTKFTNNGRIAINNVKVRLQIPDGWTAKADTPSDFNNLPPGRSVEVNWTVTPPADAKTGTAALTANASFVYGDENKTASVSSETNTVIPPAPPVFNSYLSDIDWISATNGWGPVERDMSVGESQAKDGKTLTIGGKQYTKGLGTHAHSEITYYLGGEFKNFTAEVGLDDEVGNNGAVTFEVWADGQKVYDSGVVKGADLAKPVNVPIAGVNELKLVVTDGGDGINYDHADWGNAFIAK